MFGRPYHVLSASSAGALNSLLTSETTPRMRARPWSAAEWTAASAATSSHHWPKSVSMMIEACRGASDAYAGAAVTNDECKDRYGEQAAHGKPP